MSKCKENFTIILRGIVKMNKQDLENRAKSVKPALVGEMENSKTNKGNWIAIVVAGIVAITMMIIEGALGHYMAIFAIGSICYAWASVFYICQYVIAKRPWPVLFGAVLHGIAFAIMITMYIISNIQAW